MDNEQKQYNNGISDERGPEVGFWGLENVREMLGECCEAKP